ncbi:MAG: epoxyqueuosine reductase [Ruminococcaceae bacterium]|nr:epoxyqueuosine reductase [Oscillospiraceae bacterium]
MSALDSIRTLAAELSLFETGVCAFDTEKRPLLSCRAASRLPDGARSVIVVLFPYAFADDRPRNLSRYACVPDYHTAAGAVLKGFAQSLCERFENERFEPFMDNSPLPEVACATAAGLGVRGDHGLLISDRYGSFVFIGCIVTTMSLPASEQARECLHCGACAEACAGGCLPSAQRDTCVSALTQKKGELTNAQTEAIRAGGLLWGCDACQEACPMNRGKEIAPHPCFTWYDPWLSQTSLDDLTDKAYGWRGKAVLRRNIELF